MTKQDTMRGPFQGPFFGGRITKVAIVGNCIAAKIEDGIYKPGDRLPNPETAAYEFRIELGFESLAASTIYYTYGALVSKGLVERRHGSGKWSFFVLKKPSESEAEGQPVTFGPPDDARVWVGVANFIAEGIAEGKYKPGVRLPHTDDFMKELGLSSRSPVDQALYELVAKGLIEKRGRGCFFVPGGGEPDSARKAERIDLKAGEDNFLKVPEIAIAMRVSKMTVYRLIDAGELEAIRIGRSFRVAERSVNDYLAQRRVGGE